MERIYDHLKVAIPTGVATYQVEMDWTMLEALAYRAAHNKTGKAKDGPLRVTITKREERFSKTQADLKQRKQNFDAAVSEIVDQYPCPPGGQKEVK